MVVLANVVTNAPCKALCHAQCVRPKFVMTTGVAKDNLLVDIPTNLNHNPAQCVKNSFVVSASTTSFTINETFIA